MTTPSEWVTAVRASHDRVAARVAGLDGDGLRRQSYAKEWNVAQVLSHLGSGSEIFSLFLSSGLDGTPPPGPEAFQPIWDRWNARGPEEQAAESVEASRRFVERLEALDDQELASLHLAMFGMELGASDLLRMRLSEHAVHAFDIEFAFDPDARVAADAVDLLVDGLGQMVSRSGKPATQPKTVAVTTSAPTRGFVLSTGGVSLEPAPEPAPACDARLELPAEALVRLVYGRLDAEHGGGDVTADGIDLAELREIFPGF